MTAVDDHKKKAEDLLNGDLKLSDAQLRGYRHQLQDDAVIPLDEIVSKPVRVAFRELVDTPVLDADGHEVIINGKPQLTKKPITVFYEIETFVPTEFFLQLTEIQEELLSINRQQPDMKKIIDLYARQVLKVWKLTDDSMTYDRLVRGLTFDQIRGLFARFFGSLNVQVSW